MRNTSLLTRWLSGILIGAILTFVLLGVLVWTYTGVGLLQLLGLFRSGKIQINTDQPTIVRQIQKLAALNPADVKISERDISLKLPKAEIFITRLDNAKTRVYSRDTGIFSIPDPNLETKVRQEAERQLHDAALNNGILKTADENARQTITTLLAGLGFTKIELR